MIVGDTGGTVADVALNAEVTEEREDVAGPALAEAVVQDLETLFAHNTDAVIVLV